MFSIEAAKKLGIDIERVYRDHLNETREKLQKEREERKRDLEEVRDSLERIDAFLSNNEFTIPIELDSLTEKLESKLKNLGN